MEANDDNEDTGACTDLITSYKLSNVIPAVQGSIGLGSLFLGLLYVFNTTLTIYWIKSQKRSAESGEDGAARYVMFPLYIPFMWASAMSDLLVGIIVLFISYDAYQSNSWPTTISVSIMWSVQHMVIEGIACLLMQYGFGMQAVRKSIYGATVWGTFTFLCYVFTVRKGGHLAIAVTVSWHFAIFVFYSILWLSPDRFICRRAALRRYARFWAIFRLISIFAIVLMAFQELGWVSNDSSDCFYIIGVLFLYVLFKPYVVYYALLADSISWQGVYFPNPMTSSIAKNLYSSRKSKSTERGEGSNARRFLVNSGQYSHECFVGDSDLVSPLHGIEVGFDEAQELAHKVDTMRAEGRVKLLNYAYLSLNKAQLLGAGSFSKVYRGKYRGTPVAIKLIVTPDLNPEIIHRVCKEAQLLSEINHPNVVEIFGVCVVPPSVCLVLEICHYGSLSDCIGNGNKTRPPLPLTFADKMYLALGCARGLEALHAVSESVCHRDVKSFNFLVDSQLNAKIADLELGGDDDEDPNYQSTAGEKIVIGCSPRGRGSAGSRSLSMGEDSDGLSRVSATSSDDNMVTVRSSFRSNKSAKSAKSYTSRSSNLKRVSRKLFGNNNREEEFLCTWQAPEVMVGAPHSQSSDIYSLGLVLWEIISGMVPFENTPMQDDIRTMVLNGKRPVMPPCPDDRYVQLIKSCWKADCNSRPDIKSVVHALTLCWEASIHRYMFCTTYVCNLQEFRRHYEAEVERTSIASSRYSSAGQVHDDLTSRHTQLARLPLSHGANKIAAYLQNETRLERLQALTDVDNSAYIILTPDAPHLVLWISKNIPKMVGYFYNDLVCGDLGCLCGPRTNRFFLRTLMLEAGQGKIGHRLITFYRRDESQFVNSVHAFPIFMHSSASRESLLSNSSIGNPTAPEQSAQQTVPGKVSRKPSASSPASSDYMGAIARSLEAAKKSTAEGAEYSPTKKSAATVRDLDVVSRSSSMSSQYTLAPPISSLENDVSRGTPFVQGNKESNSSDNASELFSNMKQNDDVRSSNKISKTLSTDSEYIYDPSNQPSQVAYIILHFSVLQDLRT